MLETWRAIEGYEDQYDVSNFGEVKSLSRKALRVTGETFNIRERILKPVKNRDGHLYVVLGAGNRKAIHRLVALAFLDNPESYPLVRHIDGDPSNNIVTNLAWGNASQNALDTREHGTNYYVNKTHCRWGHKYTEENIYWEGRKRKCRQCRTRYAADYRERQRIKDSRA